MPTLRSAAIRLRPWFWALVFVGLAAAFYLVVRAKRDLVDFEVFHRAGVRALSAAPLYRAEDGHYAFKYLPAFALAMAPFAWLGLDTAKKIWYGLSVGLLIVFVRRSVRALPEPRLANRRLMWLTVLLMGKFYVKELDFGQADLLLAIPLIGALRAAQHDRRLVAGILVGLATFVKPYALVLLPWLAWALGPSALLAFGGVVVIGLVLPAIVYGWGANLDLLVAWFRIVTGSTPSNLLAPENISLATMWAKWLGPGTVAAELALISGVAALVLAIGVGLARRNVKEPNYLEFGLLMLLIPLISPQGWDYVLLLATPAVICLVDRLPEVSRDWRIATMGALALISFTIFDVLGRALYTRLMAMSIISVAALVLAGSLAHLRWRALA